MIHYQRPIYIELASVSRCSRGFRATGRDASISDSHISSRISSRVASGIILCFVGYIITLRATLSRERRSFQGRERARGGHERRWMLRKFVDDFPESVIRRSAGTRASFVSIKRLRGKPIRGKCVYVMWKWNAARRLSRKPEATIRPRPLGGS